MIEFGDRSVAGKLAPRSYRVLIEVDDTPAGRVGPRWRKLVEFDLYVHPNALQGNYIAHRNTPEPPQQL